VSTSIVKWSGGFSNRVSINSRKYRDLMKFAVSMVVSFITFCHVPLDPFCKILYMVCVLCVSV
jgi:hypothetical protein